MVKVFDITPHRRRRRIVQSYSSGAYVPPVWAHWRHLANTTELVLPSVNPSPQSRSAVLSQLTAESLYIYNGLFIPRNFPLPWGSGPLSKHGSLDSHPSPQPKRHLDRFSHFAGLTSVTDRQADRQTDHATRSVTIDRVYVRSTGDAV